MGDTEKRQKKFKTNLDGMGGRGEEEPPLSVRSVESSVRAPGKTSAWEEMVSLSLVPAPVGQEGERASFFATQGRSGPWASDLAPRCRETPAPSPREALCLGVRACSVDVGPTNRLYKNSIGAAVWTL